jgi:hypothetical protein
MGCVPGVVVLDLETEEIMNCFQRVDICCLNADRCARGSASFGHITYVNIQYLLYFGRNALMLR